MSAAAADALKAQGNTAFKNGDFALAEDFYTQAVQRYSRNPLLFTNRANARLKLQRWEGAVNDCLKSIEISNAAGGTGSGGKVPQNHKAYYFLGEFHFPRFFGGILFRALALAFVSCERIGMGLCGVRVECSLCGCLFGEVEAIVILQHVIAGELWRYVALSLPRAGDMIL